MFSFIKWKAYYKRHFVILCIIQTALDKERGLPLGHKTAKNSVKAWHLCIHFMSLYSGVDSCPIGPDL